MTFKVWKLLKIGQTPVISACLYLEFCKRYGHQTYTNDRSWQKKKIDDIINIMTWQLMTSWRHNDVILLWRHNDVIMMSSWWWRHKSSSFVKTYNWCKFQVNTISGTKDIEGLYFFLKFVCKTHKSYMTNKMAPFLSINFQEVLLVKISGPYHVWFSRS